MVKKYKKYKFLFEELVKRDFNQKYKRTILGVFWSLLSPLLQLLVMSIVFTEFFGRSTPHYTIYLFCGNLLWAYFKDSTNGGMSALTSNAGIFSKVNVPKYLFLFSKNVSSLINYLLTLVIFAIFVIIEQIKTGTMPIGPHYLTLIYPILCLVVFNLGCGLVLSALFVFFKDTKYLYDIFTLLLMYLSAIFYDVSKMTRVIFGIPIQKWFYLNPLYCYITYFRTVVIGGQIPSLALHGLCIGYAVLMFLLGLWTYKHYNQRFLYYV